jgi:hypothetical protein
VRKTRRNKKERTDKKIDIKPTVPLHLYNFIADLSDTTEQPAMNIVEFFCMEGIQSRKVIEFISPYFRRDYQFDNTTLRGNPDLTHSRYLRRNVPCKRISTRFTKEFTDEIERLMFALGLTSLSSATGLLLEVSVKDIDIMSKFVRLYAYHLNKYQKDFLKKTLSYVYKNHLGREQVSFRDVVEMIIDEAKEVIEGVKEWDVMGLRKKY